MWSTDMTGKRLKGEEGKGSAPCAPPPSALLTSYPLGLRVLLLPALCLLVSGCRMDMQDQPKYEAYESSRSFKDGQASRPPVEGTVARGHLREDSYFYTGKGGAGQRAAGAANSVAQTGSASGGMGAAVPNTSGTSAATASQGGGDVNVRGNVGGGVPNAQAAAAMGGPDNFPFPVTKEVLERGRERYNIYCIVCHGGAGDGDGMIPRRGFQRPPSFYEDRLQEGTANAAHFFDVITNGWGAMPSYAESLPAEDRWKVIAYVRALQLSRRMNMNELPPEAQGKVRAGAQARPVGPHGVEQPEQPHRGGERGQ
jgi:mono/diheme cytochrome c family protein